MKIGAQLRLSGAILSYFWHAKRWAQKEQRQKWPSKKWILGHRGARAVAPENTLISFNLAMELGADGVEFDVWLSKDGVPVVIHDDTLERTTDGLGAVQDQSAAQLWQLNATQIPGFAKEGVPSLEQTLAILPKGAIANIELKGSGHYSKDVFVAKIVQVIQQHEARLCLIISSFDGELLRLFRQIDASYLLSLLLSTRDENWPRSLTYMTDFKPDGLHLTADLAGFFVRILARMARIRIAIWTVNDSTQAKKWLVRCIDGIFTDRVSEIIKGK